VCCLLVFKLFLVIASYLASKPHTVNKYLYYVSVFVPLDLLCVMFVAFKHFCS